MSNDTIEQRVLALAGLVGMFFALLALAFGLGGE